MGTSKKRPIGDGHHPGDDQERTRELLEDVMTELGLDPQQNRIATDDGSLAWGLMRGSAQVFIFLRPRRADKDHGSLQVLAPLIYLPSDPLRQAQLFRHLLELNASALAGSYFALKESAVVVQADRTTEDLDRSEAREMILRVGYYADLYDDALASRFGGRRFSDAQP